MEALKVNMVNKHSTLHGMIGKHLNNQ